MIVAVLFLAACGGGSGGGVSDDKKVVDLTDSEGQSLCNELAAALPEKTVDCGGGQTITLGAGGAAECVSDLNNLEASCTLTAGQYRDCIDAIAAESDADVCAGTLPPACNAFGACG